MAKQMIDEVKSAESKASEIISDAQKRATDGLKLANEKAESLVKSTAKEARNKSAIMISTAEHEAYKLKNKAITQNAEEAQKNMESAKNNVNKAIECIVKEIIPD